jgi:hypothetical protein
MPLLVVSLQQHDTNDSRQHVVRGIDCAALYMACCLHLSHALAGRQPAAARIAAEELVKTLWLVEVCALQHEPLLSSG